MSIAQYNQARCFEQKVSTNRNLEPSQRAANTRRKCALETGSTGRMIGMKTFGASAPLKELQKKFGFSAEAIVTAAKEVLNKNT